jgi:hypothetical protein
MLTFLALLGAALVIGVGSFWLSTRVPAKYDRRATVRALFDAALVGRKKFKRNDAPVGVRFAAAGVVGRHDVFLSVEEAEGGLTGAWVLRILRVRLGKRATLRLSRETASTRLAERLGFEDIHVGDDAFDARHRVEASDADVARGALTKTPVRAAIEDLEAASRRVSGKAQPDADEGWTLELNEYDELVVTVPVVELDGALLFEAVLKLADALDDARDVEPVRAPITGFKAGKSLGSGSGMPVPVPVDTTTKRKP